MINIKTKFFFFSICFFIFSFFVFNFVSLAGNISTDPLKYWAWNDVIGWIDFSSPNRNASVSSSQMTGYISSPVGYIALDCATSPNPPSDCSVYPGWKVQNDGGGLLSGWAWNDTIGWISFSSSDLNPPSGGNYQVTIDSIDGDFYGWAWNDIVGWISFNCNNSNGNNCKTFDGGSGISDYKVTTYWYKTYVSGSLESAVFDTQAMNGAAPNTILWLGSRPTGTSVEFQFASGNSPDSPFLDVFKGPDQNCAAGMNDTGFNLGFIDKFLGMEAKASAAPVYTTEPNVPVKIEPSCHNNRRYFRYKIILNSDFQEKYTPKVDDVIINWSP